MHDAQRREWNQKVIEEFRSNGGVVGGQFAGNTLLLLTTRGARSGEPRVSPLAAITADGGAGRRWAVFAANGGRPTRPGWYYNLSVDPVVTVEVGTERFQAVAEDATGAERQELWAVMSERLPSLDDFQVTAPGPIPVVVLTRR